MANSATRRTASLIGTCLGLGYVPKAPGTAGSLGALAAGMLLSSQYGWGHLQFGLLSAAAFVPAVWASGVCSAASGKKDPS